MDVLTTSKINVSIPKLLLSLVLFVPFAYFLRMLYSLYLNPLRTVPGPFWARFTRLWELRQIMGGKSHEMFISLHKKYGPVVRISPNLYSFNSPEDQKKIYDIKANFTKTAYYDAFADPRMPNLFSVRDEADHSERRKRLGSLYSMTTMVNYEPAVDKMNIVCMHKFEEFTQKGKVVQIPKFMQYYAFDVIGEITVNKNFGFMEAESDVDDLIKTMHDGTIYQSTIGIMPEFHPLMFRLGPLLGYKNEGTELVDNAVAELNRHRDNLQESTNPRADPFITKLIKLETAGKVNLGNMIDSVISNIAAGSDTTAITVSATLYYLYRTPRCLAALRKEIDDMDKEGRLSNPVTWKEAQTMSYLQAVVQETLRIHPAVGYLLQRRVSKGGIELAGRYFPEGTTVGVCGWALHRNKAIYGDDADEFRPERHLGSRSDVAASFAFGGGTRTCIGKNISLLEMFKVVPQIVRRFDLEFVDGEKEWGLSTNWFVWPEYYCRIKERAA